MPGFAVNKAAPGVRRALIITVIALVVAGVAAIGVNVGFAIRAEYHLSRSLRSSPQVTYDPEVTFGGFNFLTHASSGTFSGAVITARGVDVDGCPAQARCRAELGATLGEFSVPNGWTIRPDDPIRATSIKAYTRLDSVNLGRMLGIINLTVNTPAPAGKAGGGGPQDGLLRRTTGVLLTGTVALPGPVPHTDLPPSASAYPGPKVTVSVNVDLSIVDGRLHLQATGFYTGPEEHVDSDVAPDQRVAVLAAFTHTLPTMPLPWQIVPQRAYSEGSDVLIAGDVEAREVSPDRF